jgi:hypothetical protein
MTTPPNSTGLPRLKLYGWERRTAVDRLWFRAKTYGWGWTPATIEGWLVLGLFFAGVLIDVVIFTHRLRAGVAVRTAMTAFFVWIAVLSGGLFAVCWVTGERPRWHWGD